MADSILMTFLRAGLIQVGGDDAKLAKLTAAANKVAQAVVKTPAKALPFALVAFDAEVEETEPVVEEVFAILSEEWPTHFNTTMGSPVAVARALLVAGLATAAEKNIAIAAAFVAAARNVLPHVPTGSEANIWTDLVQTLENRVESEAERAWALPDSIEVRAPELKVGAVEVPVAVGRIDRNALKAAFEGAAGPHNNGNEPGTDNPNPFWPNSAQQWVSEFGVRAAKAVGDAVDPALRLRVGPIEMDEVLGPLAASFNQQIQDALTAITSATAGLQRRSNLLWWKEALYSPSLRLGYRSLSPASAAAAMAFDLYTACPALTPLSVNAFLRETVERLPKVNQTEPRAFFDLVKDLSADPASAPLRTAVAGFGLGVGRGPVLSIIGGPTGRAVDAAEFRDLTGVPGDVLLSPSELAVWLFQELQACRVTQAEPTRRSRKAA